MDASFFLIIGERHQNPPENPVFRQIDDGNLTSLVGAVFAYSLYWFFYMHEAGHAAVIGAGENR